MPKHVCGAPWSSQSLGAEASLVSLEGQQASGVSGVFLFVSAFIAGAESTLDVLYCELRCRDMAQVRRVWTALSARLQGEEQIMRMLGFFYRYMFKSTSLQTI